MKYIIMFLFIISTVNCQLFETEELNISCTDPTESTLDIFYSLMPTTLKSYAGYNTTFDPDTKLFTLSYSDNTSIFQFVSSISYGKALGIILEDTQPQRINQYAVITIIPQQYRPKEDSRIKISRDVGSIDIVLRLDRNGNSQRYIR